MDMDQAFEGLKQIAKKCWQTSEDKGWHTESRQYEKYRKLVEQAPTVELHDMADAVLDALGDERTKGVPVMSKLMLICTEVAEAAEVFRNAKVFSSLTDSYYEQPESDMLHAKGQMLPYDDNAVPRAKPEGFGSELADVVIRVFDLAEDLGIDLATEIKRKMLYNESRTYRHGGKVA